MLRSPDLRLSCLSSEFALTFSMFILSRVPVILLLLVMAFFILVLDHFVHLQFLWVFPLYTRSLGLWLVFVIVDTFLVQWGYLQVRWLTWCAGILFFTALCGLEWLGILIIAWPILLWVLSRQQEHIFKRLIPFSLLVFLFFAHFAARLQPALEGSGVILKLFSLFFFLRQVAWSFSVVRKQHIPFLPTMEYFLSPIFWLCPMHTSYLTTQRFFKRVPQLERAEEGKALGWIGLGIAYALVFGLAASRGLQWLLELYPRGLWHWHWQEFVAVGPVLFALNYLEKARVTYLTAGFLRLQGCEIEPDFRHPWAARDLVDYWRRFHYWVIEFYEDYFYSPLQAWFCQFVSHRLALIGVNLITFSVASFTIHYLVYPGDLVLCVLLGLIFGLMALLHSRLSLFLQKHWVGLPVTWVTVFFLYFLAFPVYVLGWGFPLLLNFFLR